MVKSSHRFTYRKENLVTCPMCNGHKRVVVPTRQGQDDRCHLCSGHGVVLNDVTCVCGRPLRLDALGQVKGALYSCGRKPCKETLEKEMPPATGEAIQGYRRIKKKKEDPWENFCC